MKSLGVYLNYGLGDRLVGRLVAENRKVFFTYAAGYLESGHNISPLKLRWAPEPQRAVVSIFDGLFGVFADSLPDGWGRLLLDRQLAKQDVDLNDVNPLERLAYVGTTGKGALSYRPELPLTGRVSNTALALDELSRQTRAVLADQDVAGLPELLRLGGSSGGARPKIQVLYNPVTAILLPDELPIPTGYSAWII